MDITDDDKKELNEIFFPLGSKKHKDFIENNNNLVYYTTAETAKNILRNQELWMRNASVMNDFSEVRFALDRLRYLLYAPGDDSLLKLFVDDLDKTLSEIFKKCVNAFFNFDNGESTSWQYNTYITSFTYHESKENNDGRLSMWRAYGGDKGVAIVFKKGFLFESLSDKNIFISPVAYFDEEELKNAIGEIARLLKGKRSFLAETLQKDDGEQTLLNEFMWALRFAVVSVKHPGFAEEKEWRLVANGIDLSKEKNCADFELENVKGYDQLVYKVKFSKEEMFDMIDSILIGPNADFGIRNITHKAFAKIISDAFEVPIDKAEKKVKSSNIPYRPL